MKVNLTPFSIYWFLFLILNVIYFIFPFLFFLLLPAVFVMILIWGICVFEIGRATIISSQTKQDNTSHTGFPGISSYNFNKSHWNDSFGFY